MFLIVYGVIVIFAGLAAWLVLRFLKDRPLAWAMVSVKMTIAVEQIYYGVGRFWPKAYAELSWYWPGVMFFKAMYCFSLGAVVWYLVTHRERA
jgi:hypothetical protein